MFLYRKAGFSRLVFAKPPYVRTQTLHGVDFEVHKAVQPAHENKYGLESQQWFLTNAKTGDLLSPWHHIDIAPAVAAQHVVTGVIEITKGTNKKLEIMKEIAGNPVM
jgi:hypothetical protein